MKLLAVALAATLTACASAGPYGHARVYAPLSEEEAAAQGSVEYDPIMAKRSPERWKGKTVSLFGVVVGRNAGASGAAEVKLSVRTLEPRNLCDSSSDDSCRVTVGDHEHAIVHAKLRLTAEDDLGEHSVGSGSLIRVVGSLEDEVHVTDGEPVIQARYYRHWPRGFYVTTADRAVMRR